MRRKSEIAAERADDENPEWTRAMFRDARPAAEVLPEIIGEHAAAELLKRGRGRPRSKNPGVVRSFRLPRDLVQAYEGTGKDWRKLVEQTLRDHMPRDVIGPRKG